MISIQALTKNFGKTRALDNIDAELSAGQCIGLIGPNACGKTTLIKCMLGMVIPSQGDIYFRQEKITKDVRYKEYIGYMPQIGKYPENITIKQVFDMIRTLRQTRTQEDWELYDSFGLSKIEGKKMATLSGGTIQKVSAAMAFLHQPEVLILDEPTAGLDPLASEILRNKIVDERQKGKLILITSHVLSELDDLLTNVIFMQEARILFSKTIHEIILHTGESRISKAVTKLLKKEIHD